jgi:hypothetical protein
VAELASETEAIRQQQGADWEAMQGAFPAGCPPYNPTRYRLGTLCKRAHEWGATGRSLRPIRKDAQCVYCHAEDSYARHHDPQAAPPRWAYDPTRPTLRTVGEDD